MKTQQVFCLKADSKIQCAQRQRVSSDNIALITLSPEVHLVKAMGFPVVMYGCESWTIKKAEH